AGAGAGAGAGVSAGAGAAMMMAPQMMAGAAGMPMMMGAAGGGACSDSCPRSGGVPRACQLRFVYGVNYAWHSFAGDFGGIPAWNQHGVSAEPAVATELATMAQSGVNVVRWWLWPDFRGDGVVFDGSDTPTGLGGTARADVERALELAD